MKIRERIAEVKDIPNQVQKVLMLAGFALAFSLIALVFAFAGVGRNAH